MGCIKDDGRSHFSHNRQTAHIGHQCVVAEACSTICQKHIRIATLRDLVREYKSNGGNPKKLSSLDSKIHLQIAQSTGSAIYINLSLLTRDVLGQVLKHHRVQIFEDLVHVSQIGRKNWLLVEALSDGNPDKAEEIMRDRRAYFGKALDLDLDMSEQPKAAVPIEQINLYR